METNGMAPINASSVDISSSDYGSDIDLHHSDYGSDFDEEEETLIGDLLAALATPPVDKTIVYPTVETEQNVPATIVHNSPLSVVARVGNSVVEGSPAHHFTSNPPPEVEYDIRSRGSWGVLREQLDEQGAPVKSPRVQDNSSGDKRSPLERFRTKPKKPLSVTDLVSPAWCELQYWYSMAKFGKKPQTAAMKQGSKVHKALEEQVHRFVPIKIESAEDRFGLRIWNTIQGVRTLRATGLTRELEIWGIVQGQVVNGVIDEISYACPDPDFEESIERPKLERVGGTLPFSQLNIRQGFAAERKGIWSSGPGRDKMVYISDVKARSVKSVPTGASLRPTRMQLMLYRKLLESLALNTVDAVTIFERYDLRPLEQFTADFTKEVSGLGNFDATWGNENSPNWLRSSEIETHNNLSALWGLMISELQDIGTISDILRAEFRYSKTGEVIGNELLAYDYASIESYLVDEMNWWKGKREVKGIELEEAFKCRLCDFADECTWRKAKIEEATEKHRLRIAKRTISAV
ncbi:hypothetical protein CC78DRAFT_95702 [Lojkania enalia]|uniref:Exonuclease V n=1 Tax=Lojkania enalia TaxID=147567 RepID=A0A9P4JX58_9PLEO|nr:hypothetical protein CC78DRAFT_95702 [Didymosphaeria enalia]